MEQTTDRIWAKAMTWDDLADFIATIDPSRRSELVKLSTEDGSALRIVSGHIFETDQINPTGEGWESINSYVEMAQDKTIPEWEREMAIDVLATEQVVASAGSAFLTSELTLKQFIENEKEKPDRDDDSADLFSTNLQY